MSPDPVTILGWSLLHFLWQGALIALVYALLRHQLRDSSAQARYLLGVAALALLALCPLLTGVSYWLVQTAAVGTDADAAALVVTGVARAVPMLASLDAAQVLEQIMPVLVAFWSAGVLLLSMRVLRNWLALRRMIRSAQPAAAHWQQVTDELARKLSITRPVRIMQSALVQVPCVAGWLKPVILLPSSTLLGLSSRQLELVIAHELAHVMRWDFAVNLCQVVIETLLFYHPAVRWISGHIRDERELCCDDEVVSRFNDRMQYARALSILEELRADDPAPAMAATGGPLVVRVQRILGLPGSPTDRRQGVSDGLVIVIVMSLALLIGLRLIDSGDEGMHQLPAVALLPTPPPMRMQAPVMPRLEFTIPRVEPLGPPHSLAGDARISVAPASAPEPVVGAATSREPAMPSALAPAPAPVLVSDAAVPLPAAVQASNEVELAAMQPAAAEQSAVLPVTLSPSESVNGAMPASPPMPEALEPVAEMPVLLRSAAPAYPIQARRRGVQGHVLLQFSIADNGRATDIEVVEAYPEGQFERAATRAMARWRFANGADQRYEQEFSFSLESETSECRLLSCSPPTIGSRIRSTQH